MSINRLTPRSFALTTTNMLPISLHHHFPSECLLVDVELLAHGLLPGSCGVLQVVVAVLAFAGLVAELVSGKAFTVEFEALGSFATALCRLRGNPLLCRLRRNQFLGMLLMLRLSFDQRWRRLLLLLLLMMTW